MISLHVNYGNFTMLSHSSDTVQVSSRENEETNMDVDSCTEELSQNDTNSFEVAYITLI